MIRFVVIGALLAMIPLLWSYLKSGGNPAPKEMTPCAKCGAFVPREEAIPKNAQGETQYFCSSACLPKS